MSRGISTAATVFLGRDLRAAGRTVSIMRRNAVLVSRPRRRPGAREQLADASRQAPTAILWQIIPVVDDKTASIHLRVEDRGTDDHGSYHGERVNRLTKWFVVGCSAL